MKRWLQLSNEFQWVSDWSRSRDELQRISCVGYYRKVSQAKRSATRKVQANNADQNRGMNTRQIVHRPQPSTRWQNLQLFENRQGRLSFMRNIWEFWDPNMKQTKCTMFSNALIWLKSLSLTVWSPLSLSSLLVPLLPSPPPSLSLPSSPLSLVIAAFRSQ